MRIVLSGAPGSGKGTEAELLSKKINIPHISTGDILRRAIAEKTKLGIKAKSFVEGGGLVPDGVMIALVEERLKEEDCQDGFILDGFPRTLTQAKALEKSLAFLKVSLDFVLHLEASEEILVERLEGRRVCKKCHALFHIKNMPPVQEGVCDRCQGELYQRSDDKEEVVKDRLKIYRANVEELLIFYQGNNLLRRVDSGQGVQKTLVEIEEIILK